MIDLVGNVVSELDTLSPSYGGAMGGIFAAMFVFFGLFLLVLVGIYVYTSFAFMKIGQRAKNNYSGLAWIPSFGPTLVAYFSDKRNKPGAWWFLLGGFVGMLLTFVFVALAAAKEVFVILAILFGIASFGCLIYFAVMSYIWTWRMFEKIKRPGWWGLIPLFTIPFLLLGLIPFVGVLFGILSNLITLWYLIMIGIAAWSDP